ncbi:MAG TPA: MBL fold metallo-hydrolase, partial [Oscillatoriaceae cyanobacterium]
EGDEAKAALELYHGEPYDFEGGPIATELADGDRLDGRFTVHHAPGHCAGQVCLQLGGVLFTADHVLPNIFPHLSPAWNAPFHGVAPYEAALDRMAALPDVRLALPGHGPAMHDLAERIATLKRLSDRMMERVWEATAVAPTLAAVTRAVYPTVDGYHALLALEKVAAYVEELVRQGRVAMVERESESWRFLPQLAPLAVEP